CCRTVLAPASTPSPSLHDALPICQNDPGGFGDAVDQAVRRGNVFSVRQITSQPGDPSAVNLFYGESWSLLKYLNDTYGPEKFARSEEHTSELQSPDQLLSRLLLAK